MSIPIDVFPQTIKLTSDTNTNNKIFFWANIRIISTFLCYASFFLLYNTIISHKKYAQLKVEKSFENKSSGEDYDELYTRILTYFEDNNPWKNSELNINDLALALNSNSTYISRTINQKAKLNFKTFVNIYRINYVKAQLEEGNYDRYTLTSIYTEAGFKHQSTFNKVFKEIENITPTEFINKISDVQKGSST